MTAHKRRAKAAKGHVAKAKNGKHRRVKYAAEYDPEDFRIVSWWAKHKNKPLAEIMRDALWAYILPIRADAPPRK